MNKKTIIIIAVVIVAVIAIVCCAVFMNKKDNNNEASNNSSSVIKETSIVGEWKNTLEGFDFIYTFNADGSGKYDAAGTLMPFTYTIDGDKISILYEGDTVSFDTTFSVNGDTLNVVDSMGEDTLYTKVK